MDTPLILSTYAKVHRYYTDLELLSQTENNTLILGRVHRYYRDPSLCINTVEHHHPWNHQTLRLHHLKITKIKFTYPNLANE